MSGGNNGYTLPPGFDLLTSVFKRNEPVGNQAFVPRLPLGHSLLELADFLLKSAQPVQRRNAQAAELILPSAKRRQQDPGLAADLIDRRTRFGLAQRKRDLLLRGLAFFHSELFFEQYRRQLLIHLCPKKQG